MPLSEILKQPFRGLSDALGIRGGAAGPANIDLGQAHPTFNLEMFARAENSRIFLFSQTHTHVATGTIRSLVNPWKPADADGYTPQTVPKFAPSVDDLIVITGAGASVSESTDFDRCQIALAYADELRANTDSSGLQNDVIWLSSGVLITMDNAAQGSVNVAGNSGTIGWQTQPRVMRSGMFLSFMSNADTGGTVTVEMWVSMLLIRRWARLGA